MHIGGKQIALTDALRTVHETVAVVTRLTSTVAALNAVALTECLDAMPPGLEKTTIIDVLEALVQLAKS